MVKRLNPIICVRKNAGGADFPELDGNWIPRLDLVETEKSLVVVMEASGLGIEDLTISLQPNRLEIEGRKKKTAVPPGTRYLRLEREYGPFRRTLALPRSVIPAKARATLLNGVLTIVLPKPIQKKVRERVVRITKNME